MTFQVLRTTLADIQIRNLRSRDHQSFGAFAEDLRHRGCAALGYRLTGPAPINALCVKHLTGALRAVVAFRNAEEVLILLVAPHLRDDPARDVYTLLYELAGIEPPEDEKRTKPPCCDEDSGLPGVLEEEIEDLVERAARLARGRR